MTIYYGNNNNAKQIKQMYISVNNNAKKIKYGYIGINNNAKLFYKGESYTKFLDVNYSALAELIQVYTNNKTKTSYLCNSSGFDYNLYSNTNIINGSSHDYIIYTEADYIYLPKNCTQFFLNCRNNINYSIFKFDYVQDATYMFEGANQVLDKINFYNENFNNITRAGRMFTNCTINIPYLYLNNVTEIAYIFSNIQGEVNIKNVFFPKATDWSYVFYSTNFKNATVFTIPSHVTNIDGIFRGTCNNFIKGPLYINNKILSAKEIFGPNCHFIGNIYLNSSFDNNIYNFSLAYYYHRVSTYKKTPYTRINIILQNTKLKKMAYTHSNTSTAAFDVSTTDKLNNVKINVINSIVYPLTSDKDRKNACNWKYNASNNCIYNTAIKLYIYL